MASNPKSLSSELDAAANDETKPLFGSEKYPLKYGEDVETPMKKDAVDTARKEQQQDSLSTFPKTKSIREIILDRPKPNLCHLLFCTIELVATLASLCLLATQVIPIVVDMPDVGFTRVALRIYVACFCIIFVFVELQAPLPYLRDNKAFQGYISRGFLQSFIGLIGIEQAYSQRIEDVVKHASSKFHIGWTPLFMQVSSCTMVVVGYIYVGMGVLRMKQLRTKLQENYQERLDEYRRGEQHGVEEAD